jgi:4-diphosphocytidyl-2-C-methyl-D-erythritol kinase
MTFQAFAKINLGLEVVRRRPDGYHDIRTLFQTINLADELSFEPAAGGVITVGGDDPSVLWDDTNLVHRAARTLRERAGKTAGAAVFVKKNIPAGRGLGGGSSDAAVTLMALDAMWGLGLPPGELSAVAKSLGADVPYFLKGGLCLGEGIGDILTPLPDLDPLVCALAFPAFAISTAEVYGAYPPSLTSEGKPSKIVRFLESGDFGLLGNDLEHVIFRDHPELEAVKRSLQDAGALLTMVSGSGSAVYGLFADRDKAREALARLGGTLRVHLAETLPQEGYRARLGAGV